MLKAWAMSTHKFNVSIPFPPLSLSMHVLVSECTFMLNSIELIAYHFVAILSCLLFLVLMSEQIHSFILSSIKLPAYILLQYCHVFCSLCMFKNIYILEIYTLSDKIISQTFLDIDYQRRH